MSRGTRKTLISARLADLSTWPAPDENVLSEHDRSQYRLRRQAVELYAADLSLAAIRESTGKCAQEVRRLVRRCLRPTDNGDIYGFYALLAGQRIEQYRRCAPLTGMPEQGGYGGALKHVFERFPELRQEIEEKILKRSSSTGIPEARISYVDLHKFFLQSLRKFGFTDCDWPFNAKRKGYNALRIYAASLWQRDLDSFVAARGGTKAVHRLAVGTGNAPFLPCLRPYSYVQLDYHKIDAQSIITIRTPDGMEHDVQLARWHIGVLIEQKKRAILGVCIALETSPSSDTSLETIYSALQPESFGPEAPEIRYAPDGKIVINQFLPELAYQSFSMLKVDNGWCNTAVGVVSNVIDVIGCAVNFGPTYSWWMRPHVERIFKTLEQRGLQRLPSTFGSGPGDTRVDNPAGKASTFRIRLSDLVALIYGCVRDYNSMPTEGLHFASPIEAMQSALKTPGSGLFPRPLPKARQQDMRLLMHVVRVTVRGNIKKGIRPHFNLARGRYTNEGLANHFHLVDKKLVAYVNRRTCEVRATVLETGEDLGVMLPEQKWRTPHTWQERGWINRDGMAARLSERADVVTAFAQERAGELILRKGSGKKKASRAANQVAHRSKLVTSNAATPNGYIKMGEGHPTSVAAPKAHPAPLPVRQTDPFGFFKRTR